MLIWLDDRRDPNDYGCAGWTWVKSAREAIEALETGDVQAISLDHDLGPEADGHSVVLWMEEHGWPPHGAFVHSSNAPAAEKMRMAIDRAYPDLARHRVPFMTPLEQGVLTNFLVRRSLGE